jgi:hypothetical protein
MHVARREKRDRYRRIAFAQPLGRMNGFLFESSAPLPSCRAPFAPCVVPTAPPARDAGGGVLSRKQRRRVSARDEARSITEISGAALVLVVEVVVVEVVVEEEGLSSASQLSPRHQ